MFAKCFYPKRLSGYSHGMHFALKSVRHGHWNSGIMQALQKAMIKHIRLVLVHIETLEWGNVFCVNSPLHCI